MKLKRLSLGALSLLFFVSCGKGGSSALDSLFAEKAPQEYPTLSVSEQNAELQTTYPVTVKGQEDIDIKPRIDGFIDAIYIDEGAVVRKGQALFKINSPQAEQAYNTATAAVNSAEAQVNTAKLNVDRLRPLAEKGIISNVQLETTINAYETAKAALVQAKAAQVNAQASLGWTTVTSPVNGVAGSISFRQGSLVNSQNVLTTIANISNVYAYFSLNEKELMQLLNTLEGSSQAQKIKNLPPITLTLADGSVYPEKGKIETITGSINITTGTATLRALFPNQQGQLRSGSSGKITIPYTLENVFVIPQKATFSQQDKRLVYRVEGDSVMQKIITVLPMPDGQYYAVTSGLNAGEKIVTDGIATLKNGQKIIVR
ncbi:MAG: efflux RND transporter periplasmic adaptor subunit [Dysgonamonadaceae bacterium]|jgi:membrane fusion protein (multidrug efflux system)|nr:efflux RND transporter periplasmic adaptor subunit [Dysgonamonadaceae bacterium]